MSFSCDQSDKFNLQRTPSPGGDYNSLLNDSSTNKYNTEEFENIRDYSPIEPKENSHSEIIRLRSENKYLRAQLDIITKEKEMHVISNAQERNKNIKNLKYIKDLANNELQRIKKENEEIGEKNKELVKKNKELQGIKIEKLEFYKKQLENQEKHYQILLRDKDRIISTLTKEVQDKKNRKNLTPKSFKKKSRQNSGAPSIFSSPKSSIIGHCINPRQKLDEISQIIVQLEKKQAELKESAAGVDYLPESSYQFQSLKDLTEKNSQKSNKIYGTQRKYLNSRLSSEY